MTHADYVDACRCLLFSKSGAELSDACPKPTVEWKKACKECILPSSCSATRAENIFKQASLDTDVYSLAKKVMDKFMHGETKGQKPPSTSTQLHKKIDFKQHYFEALQSLVPSQQKSMLSRVLQGSISIAELQSEAKCEKAMNTLKEVFLRCVNKETWKEAVEAYPHFVKEGRLKPFLGLQMKSRNGIPQPFRDFCQAAINSVEGTQASTPADHLMKEGCRGDFILATYQSITKSIIKAKVSTFQGASLIIAENMLKDQSLTEEEVRTMILASKEINSASTSLEAFNFILHCRPEDIQIAISVSKQYLDFVEVLYVCLDGSNIETMSALHSHGRTMTSSVSCLVVGHWSHNKMLCLVHNNGLTRNYMVVSNELEMWQKVITTFSFEGQCVLVLLDGADPGSIANTCLSQGRNNVTLYSQEETLCDLQMAIIESQVVNDVEQ